MFVFFVLLPLLVIGIAAKAWELTEHDREINRLVRASLRRECTPAPKRASRWLKGVTP